MKHPASDTPELLINEPQRGDRTIVLVHVDNVESDDLSRSRIHPTTRR